MPCGLRPLFPLDAPPANWRKPLSRFFAPGWGRRQALSCGRCRSGRRARDAASCGAQSWTPTIYDKFGNPHQVTAGRGGCPHFSRSPAPGRWLRACTIDARVLPRAITWCSAPASTIRSGRDIGRCWPERGNVSIQDLTPSLHVNTRPDP